MSADKTILVIGTYDTKDDELSYLAGCITAQGGGVLRMDVSVLGNPLSPVDITKAQVAQAGGSSIQAAIDSGDENTAMQIMARGAAAEALRLCGTGAIDGVIALETGDQSGGQAGGVQEIVTGITGEGRRRGHEGEK